MPETYDFLQPPFRLPEAWYRASTTRLQARLTESGLDGMLLENVWNIIYFSGLFHSTTERPFWLFIPAKGEPTIIYPALDRDLVETWWIADREWYFDYPHHGAFNAIEFEPGPSVDVFAWMLRCLAARGHDRSVIGIEKDLSQQRAATARRVLPGASFRVVGDICEKMRQIKTPDEIAMIRKVMAFQDHLLDYSRRFILEHGTSVTDFDVQLETVRYGTHLLMGAMKPDGKPHNAVGVDLWFDVRAGPSTAYPHPNQFFYHRLQRGDAVQLAGFVHVGGYNGELYRAIQLLPGSALQAKAWDVHTAMTELQAQLCRAGAACNQVAGAILKLARDSGLSRYVYHRPAHGIGMEGHQAPQLSLGDETILEEGMVFSSEPGLYNPAEGWGYTHCNTVLVGKEHGIILNSTPLTKEWCWLDI